jgi:hypothetical protein
MTMNHLWTAILFLLIGAVVGRYVPISSWTGGAIKAGS